MNPFLTLIVFLASTSTGINAQDRKHDYEKLSEQSFKSEDDCKSAEASDLDRKQQLTNDYIDKALSSGGVEWANDERGINNILESNNTVRAPQKIFQDIVRRIDKLKAACLEKAIEKVQHMPSSCEKINPHEWKLNPDKEKKVLGQFQYCASDALILIHKTFKEYFVPKVMKTKITVGKNGEHIDSNTREIM